MFLSLAATLASYNFSYADPRIVDASFVYRGWPLHWVVESWSWWSPPEYPHSFHFEPLNFLVDIVFWAVVFQLPTVTLLLLKGSPKKTILTYEGQKLSRFEEIREVSRAKLDEVASKLRQHLMKTPANFPQLY